MKFNKLIKLSISIIICEFAGVIGSIFTTPSIEGWYKNINKPSFNPPNWIFGPVWALIFLFMGIAFYIAWDKKWVVRNEIGNCKKKAWNPISQKLLDGSWQKANIILIFVVQLFLNILWSVVFFGMHRADIAFFVLLMLWAAIVYTMVNFYRVSKTSSLLLLPYILWVSFAGVLNFYLWILN